MKSKNDKAIINFRIEVPTELWLRFKDTVPRSKTLHQAILEAIEKEAKK